MKNLKPPIRKEAVSQSRVVRSFCLLDYSAAQPAAGCERRHRTHS